MAPKSAVKTVSQEGLAKVFGHEGVVPGIYNCPANHATFGIGSLLHEGLSKILSAVKATHSQLKGAGKPKTNVDFASYVKLYQQSPQSPAVEYLDVEIGKDKSYKSFIESLLAAESHSTSKSLITKESGYLERGWDDYLKTFRKGIQKYEEAVRKAFVDVPLTQDQFDGFFSLTYNIGPVGLLSNKGLISAMKTYSNNISGKSRDSAASALLDQILRARPTAPSAVSGKVDDVSFKLTESGAFNSGLFNRRVREASLILGHEYSRKDAEICLARRTIKAEKDHATTQTAKDQVRTVIKGLNAIDRINRGGI